MGRYLCVLVCCVFLGCLLIPDVEEQHLVLDVFDGGGMEGWTTESRSLVEATDAVVYSGSHVLCWTYNDNGVQRWGNRIMKEFTSPMDWTDYDCLSFWFRANDANPDKAGTVFLNVFYDGIQHTGAVAQFVVEAEDCNQWRKVSLDISLLQPRDLITAITFHVDGNQFDTGDHVWYIDDLVLCISR